MNGTSTPCNTSPRLNECLNNSRTIKIVSVRVRERVSPFSHSDHNIHLVNLLQKPSIFVLLSNVDAKLRTDTKQRILFLFFVLLVLFPMSAAFDHSVIKIVGSNLTGWCSSAFCYLSKYYFMSQFCDNNEYANLILSQCSCTHIKYYTNLKNYLRLG
jgi:hypothetical protein